MTSLGATASRAEAALVASRDRTASRAWTDSRDPRTDPKVTAGLRDRARVSAPHSSVAPVGRAGRPARWARMARPANRPTAALVGRGGPAAGSPPCPPAGNGRDGPLGPERP